LDLGAVIGRVILETRQFDTAYARTEKRMAQLGTTAGDSSVGVRRLDMAMAEASAAANKATAATTKTTDSTLRAGAAADKAAAATARQTRTTTADTAAQQRAARTQAEMAAIRQRVTGASTRQATAEYRLAAAQARVNELQTSGVATTRQLATAQATLLNAQKRVADGAVLSATRMASAGKKMSHAITLPVVAAGAIAIHEAAQFEQATNVYVTAAGESSKNLGVIRDGIKHIAVETGTSIDNLTSAEYVLEKAGLRGAQGMQVLDASAKGAREENADLADVVQAMTSVMSGFHIPASRAVQVMNALKTGAGQAKVTMEDYSRALSTVIPIATANGVSLDQVLGGFSQLTRPATAPSTRPSCCPRRSARSPHRTIWLRSRSPSTWARPDWSRRTASTSRPQRCRTSR
jgi:hypothetical protein